MPQYHLIRDVVCTYKSLLIVMGNFSFLEHFLCTVYFLGSVIY